jgi:hypothetical protein
MNVAKQKDPIDSALIILRGEATTYRAKPKWPKVKNDLRAYYAEYLLSITTEIIGVSFRLGSVDTKSKNKNAKKTTVYRKVGVPSAGIKDARDRLKRAQQALGEAHRLPDLMAEFGVTLLGRAGAALLPKQGVDKYLAALEELTAVMNDYEFVLNRAVYQLGETKGKKPPLVKHLIGSPIQLFIRRLLEVWHYATGRKTEGGPFIAFITEFLTHSNGISAENLEAKGSDFKDNIKAAKRLNLFQTNEFDVLTNIMSARK